MLFYVMVYRYRYRYRYFIQLHVVVLSFTLILSTRDVASILRLLCPG
jgi:hypothetical protein